MIKRLLELPEGLRRRSLALLVSLMLLSALMISACGGPDNEVPDASMKATTNPERSAGGNEGFSGMVVVPIHGASTASTEERIFLSDVIVRASLVSTGDGLRFRAVEYLKGTGAAEFTVKAGTTGRNTSWDNRDAILFLDLPSGSGDANTSSSAEFRFVETSQDYTGGLPVGYSVDRRNPVWLPAASSSSTSDEASASGSSTFITGVGVGTGDSPTITLTDLKSKIAWLEGGDGIAGYSECIRESLRHLRFYRDWEAYYQSPWTSKESQNQVPSGTGAGTNVSDFGTHPGAQYDDKLRLTGEDAGLFTAQIVDDDEVASNGYSKNVTIVRPLPGDRYTFVFSSRLPRYIPCNFSPVSQLKFVVTVTAPAGTVHEAFFDSQAIGIGDGYVSSGNLSTGDLSPAAFTTGDTTTTITSFYGTGDAITMILSPYVDLTTHILDFITGDGTTMLSLTGATGDSAAGALTWGVSRQPWSSGDQLMLRISEPLITLSDNLAQKESSDTTLNLGSGYNTGPVLYQKLGPKVKLDNGAWAYGSEHDKFAVHRITLASDPGVRLTARFCRYDDDLHTIYHSTDSTFDYSPAIYEDCLAGDFVSSSDTAEGRRVLLHSAGGSVEVPGNGQKESQKWYLRIAPSDVSASSFKVRFTGSNDETGWAIANKVLWTEVNTGGSGSNDKANRLGKSVALQIDGRRLGCPSGMNLVNGKCATP